jgi:vancomycin resistance protein VanJ
VIAAAALVLALLLAGHRYVPDVFTLGTILDSALPWLGVFVVPLLLLALLRRSLLALAAVLVPVLVWSVMFLPAVLRSPAGGPSDLRVAEQNVYAGNGSPTQIAASLAGTGAQVIGVEEVTGATAAALQTALGARYPYVIRVSTLELWSEYPLGSWSPVNIGLGWTRALHTTVTTPKGQVSLYLAHLDSFRFDSDSTRDAGLADLGAAVRADPSKHVLLLGDLNTASTDRHFSALSPLVDAQSSAGGLGLTWPSPFPLVRPDHVMVHGIGVADAWTIAGPGSDHRGTVANLEVG